MISAPPGASESEANEVASPVPSSLSGFLRQWARRARSGESGVLPVLGGLILIVVIFQVQSPVFLSPANLTNLLVQGAVFVLLGMAEVFVLLLGEIDLSIGFVAGIGGGVAAILLASPYNLPWWAALGAGLVATAAIGAVQGTLVTRLGLPSFVVTLAGLLGWEGVLITMIDHSPSASGGVVRISNNVVNDLVNGNLSPLAGWIGMILVVSAYALATLGGEQKRRKRGLSALPWSIAMLKVGITALAGVVLVLICNTNRGHFVSLRGVPWVVPIVLAVFAGWTFLLGRTRFGRYVYAIGGNAEAARRAGINLLRVRTIAFTLSGLTAGAGGIIYASRLGSMSVGIDGGTLVLYAVAAAVIGGTSLFGGRGKALHAVLGGLVIATVYNGMGLLGMGAASQYMVTALVLVAAVTVDAFARRSRN